LIFYFELAREVEIGDKITGGGDGGSIGLLRFLKHVWKALNGLICLLRVEWFDLFN
jgi:hypothetical protein